MERDFMIKKELLVKTRQASLEEFYHIQKKKIGQGSYGKVYKVKEKGVTNPSWRAVKTISKRKMKNADFLLNEIKVLRKMDHPNIIKIYEILETSTHIHIVEDYCEGGDLFQKLQKVGNFSEADARKIFRQLLQAINYCHNSKIAHRDLKPENFLFLKKESLDLKVIDFGLSFQWQKSMSEQLAIKSSSNLVGTAYYVAPQIISNPSSYDENCDVWSLGVVLYILVSGVPPFDGKDDNEIIENVCKYNYALNIPEIKSVSNPIKDLIKKILVPSNKRLSIQQIFTHPWMVNQPLTIQVKFKPKCFLNYANYSKTKKLAANFIASQLSSIQVQNLSRLFKQIDTNKDGQISLEEMRSALSKEGISSSQAKRLMDSIDTDKNGKINYTEFIASSFEKETMFSEDNIRRTFNMLDKDGNGFVEKTQLLELFSQKGANIYRGRSVDEILQECDKDGNGLIDYQEFKQALTKQN